MNSKRRTHDAAFNARVALEALKGVKTIQQLFLKRDIRYILGEKDVNMNDSSLDKSCEGNMQGRFRLERGQFFYEYLQLYSNKKKIHQIEVVPDVAHDGDKMVNSKAARWHLFGI